MAVDARMDIKEYDLEAWMLLLFGFFAPMPIVRVAGNSAVTYFALLVFTYNVILMMIKIIKLNKEASNENIFVRIVKLFGVGRHWILPGLILIEAAIGILLCMVGPLPNIWKQGEMIRLVWEILYIGYFLFYAQINDDKKRSKVKYYIKGVYYSAIAQSIWCVMQWVYRYAITGESIFSNTTNSSGSLNQLVFVELLKQNTGGRDYSGLANGIFTLSGMCWHPANMAPLLCVGYVFTNKWPLKIFFALIAASCGNRTALVGMIACIGLDVLTIAIKLIKDKNAKKARRKLISIVCVAIAAIAALWICAPELIMKIIWPVNYSIIRTVNAIKSMQTGNVEAHIFYWICIADAIRISTPLQILFGYGADNSGYIASTLRGQFEGRKWSLECDYMNILWSYGFIGFVLRYVWYIQNAICSIKKSPRLIMFYLPIAAMGVIYNVQFNWVIFFMYSLFVLNVDPKNE